MRRIALKQKMMTLSSGFQHQRRPSSQVCAAALVCYSVDPSLFATSEHKARGSRKKRPPVHKEPTVDEEDDVVEWVPSPPPTAKPAGDVGICLRMLYVV